MLWEPGPEERAAKKLKALQRMVMRQAKLMENEIIYICEQ